MIVELTPETFFDMTTTDVGQLHVVMHYGVTCGPCKTTMPNYELVADHFIAYNRGHMVKFYKFHQWEKTYKEFITQNNLAVNGVPTFRFIYAGETMETVTSGFTEADAIKRKILEVAKAINSTIGGFDIDKG